MVFIRRGLSFGLMGVAVGTLTYTRAVRVLE
jgi:hypothetical protein